MSSGVTIAHGKFVLFLNQLKRNMYSWSFTGNRIPYGLHGELLHFLSDIANSFAFDQPHGESSQACHVFRAMALGNSAAVFNKVPVNNVMTTILNAPMTSIVLKD